jgi:hypothetical protein
VLGLRPALGRGFLPEEDQTPGAHAVTVISHKLRQTRFGGDPATVGRSVKLNGHPFTIVGVAPEKYAGLLRGLAVDWWVPVMMTGQAAPGSNNLTERGSRSFLVMGRLKPGVTLGQARADFNAIAAQLYKERIQMGDARGGANDASYLSVVGVVKDGKYSTLGEEATPFFYLNLAQNFVLSPTLVVRSQSNPMDSLAACAAKWRRSIKACRSLT